MPRPESEPDRKPPKESPRPCFRSRSAVFWSFFGVRKGRNMLQDMESIKPLHVVIVGLVAGLVFVLTLVAIVTVIMRTPARPGSDQSERA
jgi:hypothetical protein